MTDKQKKVLKDKLEEHIKDYEHWVNRDDMFEKPCVMYETLNREQSCYTLNEFLCELGAIGTDEYLQNYERVYSISKIKKPKDCCKNCKYENCKRAGK